MGLTTYTGGYILGGVADETPDWLGSYNEGMNAAIDQNTALLGQKEAKQRMAENAAAEARRAQEHGWKAAEYQRVEDYWNGQNGQLPGLQMPKGPALGPMPTQVIPNAVAPGAGLQAELAAPAAPGAPGATPVITQMLPEWARMEQQVGLPPNYLETISMLESSGGVNTGNGQYVGVFQIGPEVAADFGVTPEQLQDPRINSMVAAKLAGRNAAQLRDALGREPQGWEIYLAHQQGAGGAIALLDNPSAKAVDALAAAYGGDRNRAAQAITQNGGNINMTAGQFAALWQSKFSGGRPQPFTGGPGVSVPPSDLTPTDNPNLPPIANDVAGLNTDKRKFDTYYSIMQQLRSNPIGDAASYLFSSQGAYDQRQQEQAGNAEALAWYQSKEVSDYLNANPDALAAAARDPVAFFQQYRDSLTTAAAPAGDPAAAKGDLPAGLNTDGTSVSGPAPAAPAAPAPSTAVETPGLTPPPSMGDVVPAVSREDFAGVNAPGQGSIAQQIMRTPAGQQTVLPDSGQYMVEPAKINSDMFELQQARKLLETQYADAVRFRDRESMVAIRTKAVEVDAALRLMDNMKSIAALQGGDVNRVSQTLSRLTGGQVRIQPRSDGKLNVFFNGKKTYDGVTQEALIAALRSEYDQQYQAQVAAALKQQDEIGMEVLKSQLKSKENIDKETAVALRERATKTLEAQLRAANPESMVNVTEGADGPYVIVTPKTGGGAPMIYAMQPILDTYGNPMVDGAGNPRLKPVLLNGNNSVPVQ